MNILVTVSPRVLRLLSPSVPPRLFSFLPDLLTLSHTPGVQSLTYTTKVSQLTTPLPKAASHAETLVTSKKMSLVSCPLGRGSSTLTNA